MKKDYLLDSIKEQFKIEGNGMYNQNTDFILDSINNKKNSVELNIKNINKGQFYFMYYDLRGKTSLMEKLNPIFTLDWFDLQGTRYLYAISLNFIPVNIRTIFFNTIINNNLQTIINNIDKSVDRQENLKLIGFETIYKMLKSIGFEWAIRKFDIRLIDKVYLIDTNIINKYITMSTAKITKVDDAKLIQIWQKKISEQQQREQKLINELLNNYSEMQQQFDLSYKNIKQSNENLEKTLQIIKNI